ncbi:hypothetical protein [Maridesulfovibrio sp.]|uniref:hypothetical protein n=1 Tax=Maridesulfovibrio sp. TaxID=2795000 RepID=UPI0039EE3ECC
MKIESVNNWNFSKINIRSKSENEENPPEQSLEVKANAEASEPETKQISISARPMNMMAGSFVHSEGANDADNYSLMNLKGLKSNESLMTKFNSFMVDLVADRLAYTDALIDSGMAPIDAKAVAAAEYEKKGMDAHKKLGDDINEEELEKQAEESKEFNEERTEEVVENKQEEKAEETKETEEKKETEIQEKIAERASESITEANAGEKIHAATGTDTDPGEVTTTGSENSAQASADETPVRKGSGSGENVDQWI